MMAIPKREEEVTAVPDEWFAPLDKNKNEREAVVRPSLSYWKDAWKRLVKNKLAMLGLSFLIGLIVLAIFGPIISPHDVTKQILADQNLPLQQVTGSERMIWGGMFSPELGMELVSPCSSASWQPS